MPKILGYSGGPLGDLSSTSEDLIGPLWDLWVRDLWGASTLAIQGAPWQRPWQRPSSTPAAPWQHPGNTLAPLRQHPGNDPAAQGW